MKFRKETVTLPLIVAVGSGSVKRAKHPLPIRAGF